MLFIKERKINMYILEKNPGTTKISKINLEILGITGKGMMANVLHSALANLFRKSNSMYYSMH